MGECGKAPLIPNIGIRWGLAVSSTARPLYPLGKLPVPTEHKAVWAPESVWTLWSAGTFIALQGFEAQLLD